MNFNAWVQLADNQVKAMEPSPLYWYQEYFISSLQPGDGPVPNGMKPYLALYYPELFPASTLDGLACGNMFEWTRWE